jgi:hypothetical protein
LRPCAYWACKLKNGKTIYNASDEEILALVEAIFGVWRMYLLGCTCFSVVTNHANLVHLFKQPSVDKLTYQQTHRVKKFTKYANLMRILYRKGILNEADPVSRRPDFLSIDILYTPNESLYLVGWKCGRHYL